jgi:DNA-binding MarR family transcriptional regulator
MPNRIQQHLKQNRQFPSLEEEVFVGLQIVADRLMAPWAETLRKTADLSPVQYNVLRILRGAGAEGLWAGEVAERLITRSPDVTRLVDRLEKRGLVRRSADPADRRAVRVHITEAGLARLAPLDVLSRPRLKQIFERLGHERLVELRDGLEATIQALDEEQQQ